MVLIQSSQVFWFCYIPFNHGRHCYLVSVLSPRLSKCSPCPFSSDTINLSSSENPNSSLEVLLLLLCTLLLRSLPRSPHHTQPLYCAPEQYLYTVLRGQEHLSSPYSHECIYLLYSLSKAQTWNFKSCWLMSSH